VVSNPLLLENLPAVLLRLAPLSNELVRELHQHLTLPSL
jgi:hypothetical protein